MNRGSFLRSLFVLAASPKIIAEIKFVPKPVASTLFKDLQFLQPVYYKEFIEKYGNEDLNWWVNEIGKGNYFTMEYRWSDPYKLISKPVVGDPVTITIKKENHGSYSS